MIINAIYIYSSLYCMSSNEPVVYIGTKGIGVVLCVGLHSIVLHCIVFAIHCIGTYCIVLYCICNVLYCS